MNISKTNVPLEHLTETIYNNQGCNANQLTSIFSNQGYEVRVDSLRSRLNRLSKKINPATCKSVLTKVSINRAIHYKLDKAQYNFLIDNAELIQGNEKDSTFTIKKRNKKIHFWNKHNMMKGTPGSTVTVYC